MNPRIAADIAERLKADYEFREAQGFLRRGLCPQCGKRELYAKAEAPWLVRCGRLNKCAWEAHIRELYPDVFADFNRKYQATEQNPNATADAYLAMARGFELSRIRGWYEQGRFWHPQGNQGTATVRFWIDQEHGIYMERFVEEVCIKDVESGETKKRKAHFQGSHRGLWWEPPAMEVGEDDEVWLVEGCLDAIALHHHGIKAVAVLSCVNYPAQRIEGCPSSVRWVWALDNDAAGRKWTRRHMDRMGKEGRRCVAAQSATEEGGPKLDWNDLHLRNALGEDEREEYRYYGDLLTAKVPSEKALRMYEWTERQAFPFDFRNRLFFFKLDLNQYNKAVQAIEEQDTGMTEQDIRLHALRESGAVHEIANCLPKPLYFMANALTDESWYFFRVFFPHGAPPVNNTFSGGQLAAASEFKKRLLAIAAGALYTGSSKHLDSFLRNRIHGLKTVQTIDFVGYSKEYGSYVFQDVCVRDGKTYEATEEDYFETPKLAIRTLNQSVQLELVADDGAMSEEWIQALWTAFGPKGIAALAFWFGTLFAEQVRAMDKSFPFLEVVGDAGAGKTTLIEFLWKLVGRVDYEGFDPSKSTLAGRARNFAQVANLPIVLIEADREEDSAHSRRFDWEELKTAYNGRSVRSRGIKNAGNETYEPPFRGALVISQNAPVSASEAILSRIVHLNFTRQNHNTRSRAAAELLEQISVEDVSGFLVRSIRAEKHILKTIREKRQEMEPAIFSMSGVNTPRIAKNHAQMVGFLYGLSKLVPLPDNALQDTSVFLEEAAVERQKAINADHPLVQQFWELYEYLDGDQTLNHSLNGRRAINLNHFAEIAEKRRLFLPPMVDLKRHLKASKDPKYIGYQAVKSRLFPGKEDFGEERGARTVKCWVFEGN